MFIQIEGVKIHYLEKGEGEPLVLVHGWAGSSLQGFKHVLPNLTKRYRVIAFDLPGFGKSEPLTGKHTMEAYADFLLKFLREKKLSSIFLMGISMGGVICLKFAEKNPKLLKKLILMGTPYRGSSLKLFHRLAAFPFRFDFIQKYLGEWTRDRIQESFKSDPDFQRLNSEDQSLIRQEMESVKIRPAAESINSLINQDLTEVCRKLKISTLILDGERATIIPKRTSEDLYHLIPGSRLVIVATAGHNLVLEKPEEFNRAVLDFLK